MALKLGTKLKSIFGSAATRVGFIKPKIDPESGDTELTKALCRIRNERHAARKNNRPLNTKNIEKWRGQALEFIDKGENLNHRNIHRQDGVHLSIAAVESEITQALIVAGAKLDQLNHFGQTPLDVAENNAKPEHSNSDKYAEILDMLKEAGDEHVRECKNRDVQNFEPIPEPKQTNHPEPVPAA